MRNLHPVEPMYRHVERPVPSKPSRRVYVESQVERIRKEMLDRPPRRWRSETPVQDWLAWHGRAIARGLLRLACLAFAGWAVAWALYVIFFVEV